MYIRRCACMLAIPFFFFVCHRHEFSIAILLLTQKTTITTCDSLILKTIFGFGQCKCETQLCLLINKNRGLLLTAFIHRKRPDSIGGHNRKRLVFFLLFLLWMVNIPAFFRIETQLFQFSPLFIESEYREKKCIRLTIDRSSSKGTFFLPLSLLLTMADTASNNNGSDADDYLDELSRILPWHRSFTSIERLFIVLMVSIFVSLVGCTLLCLICPASPLRRRYEARKRMSKRLFTQTSNLDSLCFF